MQDLVSIAKSYEAFFLTLLLVGARLYGFFSTTYILSSSVSGRTVRGLIVVIFAAPIAFAVPQSSQPNLPDPIIFLVMIPVEFFKGYILGFSVGWIFWVMEAIGNIIDNQRGASIATAANPLLGQEASPLGILFSQAVNAYFYVVGGMFYFLNIFYSSFVIWPVGEWLPQFNNGSFLTYITIFQKAVSLSFLLSAPLVVVMFVAEFALAMVSRFSPQVQVFILAMPIKSALVTFLLIFYFQIALNYSMVPLEKFYSSASRVFSTMGSEITLEDVLKGLKHIPERLSR